MLHSGLNTRLNGESYDLPTYSLQVLPDRLDVDGDLTSYKPGSSHWSHEVKLVCAKTLGS